MIRLGYQLELLSASICGRATVSHGANLKFQIKFNSLMPVTTRPFITYLISNIVESYRMLTSKLEKEIVQMQQKAQTKQDSTTLQQIEADIIKNYQMKEGNYKIIITVYEANDLMPRGYDFVLFNAEKSAADSFVEIQVKQQIKRTKVKKQTNNPIFDEHFYFLFENLSVQQLRHQTIKFTVFDKKSFIISDSVIGHFQLDWTNVYFKRNHEIYRGWLTLHDPLDESQFPVGYLLVNIAVLGLDDKITVHDTAFIKDPMTTMQETITSPKIRYIDYAINLQIYRAQNLLPFDQISESVDAFVVAKFSGYKIKTKVRSSLNPQWNQLLKIGAGIPTKSRFVILQVWNRNRFMKNDLLGILRIPFVDISESQDVKPKWAHLYGPPMCGADIMPYNYSSKMQLYGDTIGSTYRGRILFKVYGKKDIRTKTISTKLKFQFPYKPTPIVPLKSYTLRVQLFEGTQLPVRNESMIQICIGQYLVKSRSYESKECSMQQWFQSGQVIQDRKVQFPQDFSQIPDVIIYYSCGGKEKDRMSYVRIPASQILTQKYVQSFNIYQLKPDRSVALLKDWQIGGYITMRVSLFTGLPPSVKKIDTEYKNKVPYILKLFLYRGQNLPPGNQQGDCDPVIKFNICGQEKSSLVQKSTCNPVWNEVIDMQIKTQVLINKGLQKSLVCSVFDDQNGRKNNYIGKFWLRLNGQKNTKKFRVGNQKIDFIYYKPKWYHIINQNIQIGDNVMGRILLCCALFRQQDIIKVPLNKSLKIHTQTEQKVIQLYLIGIRDIFQNKSSLKNQKILVELKVANHEPKITQPLENRNGGCHINKLYTFNISIPKNKCLLPYVDIKFCGDNGSTVFYGYNGVSLYDLIPKLKINPKRIDYNSLQKQEQQTLLNVENFEQQLDMVRQRRAHNSIKDKLQQKYQKIAIEKLPLPNQLGSSTEATQISFSKQVQFDKLMQQFESTYTQDPQYDYVRNLQQKKDHIQQFSVKVHRMIAQNDHVDQNQIDEQSSLNVIAQQANFTRKFLKNQEQVIKSKEQIDRLTLKPNAAKKEKVNAGNSGKMFSFGNVQRNSQMQRKSERLGSQMIEQHNATTMKRLLECRQQQKQADQNRSSLVNKNQRENQIQLRKYLRTDKYLKIDYEDLENRYDVLKKMINQNSLENISDFDIHSQDTFSENAVPNKAVKYQEVERAIQQQHAHERQARLRQQQYKYAAAVKLSLFSWRRKQKRVKVQTYQDYDTDPEQNLNIIPQWYAGRPIIISDFEDLQAKNKKLHTIPIYRGVKRMQKGDIRVRQKIASLKLIALSQTPEVATQKQAYYTRLMRPKKYMCRIYVLKGKSLISNYDVKPTTFLKFIYGGQQIKRTDAIVASQNNPQYYICQEIQLNLPGPSTVRIQIMESHNIFGKYIDATLGYTQIDLEQRYFNRKWHLYIEKKPIQLRNLYSQYGNGTQGRLQTWIQLIPKKKWLSTPIHKIHPPPCYEYELRVIVWSTKDCVHKNTKLQSNDVFVRGMIGNGQPQETDTHWSCRDTGNFNYRFKFPVSYPSKPQDMYSDVLIVQIWDRDIIGYNNLIGQARINLNRIHRIIQKAVKRRKPVKASMKIREQGLKLTDRFWFDVINHKQRNQFGLLQPQGKVQLSFQLVPIVQAKQQLANGYGRTQPNVYPTLADPSGRLGFDLLHPIDFMKQILGQTLCDKILCRCIIFILVILLVLLLYFVIGGLATGSTTGINFQQFTRAFETYEATKNNKK